VGHLSGIVEKKLQFKLIFAKLAALPEI
jgi:hypothetical protein